jgi:phosphohistidine phosphatase
MLTLLLLRHAKAVPQSGDDFTRELTAKGHRDAARLGDFLVEKGLVPDRALASPSARTRQTLEDVESASGRAIATAYDAELYNATKRQLRDRLGDVEATTATLLIVGHNPGLMELALALARDGDPQDFNAIRSHFPPCALVVIEFDQGDWEEARLGGGRLARYVTPETLDAGG